MSGRRMNDQTGRLVDEGQMLILEHHGERDGAGLERAGWFVLRRGDGNLLSAGEQP